MKLAPVVLLLACPVLLRAQTRIAPACGPDNVQFSVKTDGVKNPPRSPEVGKALVYFIEDSAAFNSGPAPTVRVGLDGAWVGATHGNSWFTFTVEPGTHHLCANWQGPVFLICSSDEVTAAHFTAQAGNTYFFRMDNIYYHRAGVSLDLTPLDSDEGHILVGKFPLAVFHRKK